MRIHTGNLGIGGIPKDQIEDKLVITRFLEVCVDIHHRRIKDTQTQIVKTFAFARNPALRTHGDVSIERNTAEIHVSDINVHITIDTIEQMLINESVVMVHRIADCTKIKQIVIGIHMEIEVLIRFGRVQAGGVKAGDDQGRFDLTSHNHIQGIIRFGDASISTACRSRHDIQFVSNTIRTRNVPHDIGKNILKFVQRIQCRNSTFTRIGSGRGHTRNRILEADFTIFGQISNGRINNLSSGIRPMIHLIMDMTLHFLITARRGLDDERIRNVVRITRHLREHRHNLKCRLLNLQVNLVAPEYITYIAVMTASHNIFNGNGLGHIAPFKQ